MQPTSIGGPWPSRLGADQESWGETEPSRGSDWPHCPHAGLQQHLTCMLLNFQLVSNWNLLKYFNIFNHMYWIAGQQLDGGSDWLGRWRLHLSLFKLRLNSFRSYPSKIFLWCIAETLVFSLFSLECRLSHILWYCLWYAVVNILYRNKAHYHVTTHL